MYEADQRLKVALFRHAVIAPLVCRRLERNEFRVLKMQILEQLFEHPDGSLRRVPERTLRHWLAKHRKHGFKGLFDEYRSDKGKNKAIPEDVLKLAEELRKEEPSRSVRTVIELLGRGKGSTGSAEAVTERTLARRLNELGATKKLLKKGAGSHQRWEQLHANDLWHGDTSHGIWLRDPEDAGKARKTKLIVFIDDASRVCPHGEFYFDEQLPKLVDCFGKALLQRGRPSRMLFDNAWIYHSTTIATMSAEMGIEISFCRPRAPQGKGKVERFIKTIQDAFMTEASRAGVESLNELNTMFQGWLNDYHRRVHSELEMTPLERWQQDVKRVSVVTGEELKRALMLRTKRKIHINTATVLLEGRDYQASVDLAGREVEVRWNPNHTDTVEIWMLGEFVEIAPLFQVKPWVEKRARAEDSDAALGTPLGSSKQLTQGWMNEQIEDSTVLKPDELLSLSETVELLVNALGRPLEEPEHSSLVLFFNRVSPIRRQNIARALDCAVLSKGVDMHLRFYIEQMDLALRRGRTK